MSSCLFINQTWPVLCPRLSQFLFLHTATQLTCSLAEQYSPPPHTTETVPVPHRLQQFSVQILVGLILNFACPNSLGRVNSGIIICRDYSVAWKNGDQTR